MTDTIYSIDAETHSPVNLITQGADAYTAHPNTRALMLGYHRIGSPEKPSLWLEGQPPPADLNAHIRAGGALAGWNVLHFDRLVFERKLVQWGFALPAPESWRDSMHCAASANLPRSLDGCAAAVGLAFEAGLKDQNRIRFITSTEKNPIPATVADILEGRFKVHDKLLEDLRWLASRCIQDVELEEGVLLRLPPWPNVEPWLNMPSIDRRINDRGVLMDVSLVQGLARAAAIETARLDVEMANITDGEVPKTTTVEQLKQWLLRNGVELPLARAPKEDTEGDDTDPDADSGKSPWRLRKSDIADLMARDDVPDKCRLALGMRAEAAKASVKKLRKMLASADSRGRLCGALVLGGAQQTLRWSGSGWQPHNMVREVVASPDEVADQNGLDPKKNRDEVQRLCAQALRTAIEAGRTGDPDLLRMLYTTEKKDMQGRAYTEHPLGWIARMLRRTIAAPEGHVILNGDWAQVEARIPVWLASQDDKVAAFARGDDIYRLQAAPHYGIAPEALTKHQRQIGKVMILACSFAGGTGAFVPMAMNYGLRVSREEADPIVKAFRRDNDKLVIFWDENLNAAVQAVSYPGREFFVPPYGLISWKMQDNCLLAKLPSGRYLRYWSPRLQMGKWPDGNDKGFPDLTVLAIKGRAIFRRTLWRGLAMENVTQAIAADMLACALVNMEKRKIPVVIHVHDNVGAEAREDDVHRIMPIFREAMLDMPAWTKGLPVAVDADYGARFG